MSFIEFMLALPAVIAAYAAYLMIHEDRTLATMKASTREKRPALHFLAHGEVVSVYESTRPHVLFHLEGMAEDEHSSRSLGITLKELRKSLPWLPASLSIFLVSELGFSPILTRRDRLP